MFVKKALNDFKLYYLKPNYSNPKQNSDDMKTPNKRLVRLKKNVCAVLKRSH